MRVGDFAIDFVDDDAGLGTGFEGFAEDESRLGLRAFGRVDGSFQYLVNSWSTIVTLISIYKRLKAFEAMMSDEPLDSIEAEGAVQPTAS